MLQAVAPGQVQALEPGQARLRPQRGEVELAIGAMGDHAVRHALFADQPVRARVSTPARPITPRAFIQPSRWLLGAKVGWLGHGAADDGAARAATRPKSTVSRSSALAPTLPMCGKVKVTICASIGGVGQDFLIAGHGRVEADLATALPTAPRPKPWITVPSAMTSTAVGRGLAHPCCLA